MDVPAARQLSPDTLLLVMSCAVSCTRRALQQQPQGLSSLKKPAPAFGFMRNMHASMQDLVSWVVMWVGWWASEGAGGVRQWRPVGQKECLESR